MNRREFMAQLERLLGELPESERVEALRFYNDYFDEAGPENEAGAGKSGPGGRGDPGESGWKPGPGRIYGAGLPG